ncbi:MAG: cyclic nucleotide-binding domain-containing protein [Myxococcota bacterium]
MTIRIKVAQAPADLRALFAVRHRVFVEEEGYMPPARGGEIVDVYDTLPTTANLCAIVDGEVAGGIRITLDSDAGVPADDFFDFRAHMPGDARVASCGMMCLRRENRDNPRLIVSLLRMCMYWGVLNHRTHLCGPVNPKAVGLIQRIGFRPVGEPFVSDEGLPSVPVVMDLAEMAEDYVTFTERQDVGLWMENFERVLFEPGEPLVNAGDLAEDAYLIVEGSADVLTPERAEPVVRLARGHVFGELALLSPRRRTHNIVAAEPTDAMVLTRDRFQHQMQTNSDIAMGLIRSLGNRFEDGLEVAPQTAPPVATALPVETRPVKAQGGQG